MKLPKNILLSLMSLTLVFSGCSSTVAANHIEKEIPIEDGFARIALDPTTSRDDLIQIIFKQRYTLYVLDHVLNETPDPASFPFLVPPGGWALGIAPVTSNN